MPRCFITEYSSSSSSNNFASPGYAHSRCSCPPRNGSHVAVVTLLVACAFAAVPSSAQSLPLAVDVVAPPPPTMTRRSVLMRALSSTPGDVNHATCLPLGQQRGGSSSVFHGVPGCALSVGCQRSLCTCLGLEFNSTSARCLKPVDQPTRSCTAVETCHAEAAMCFEQAAVLTAHAEECAAFSAPLYSQLVLAATGTVAPLRDSCLAFRCALYNDTRVTATGAEFEWAPGSGTALAQCPLPSGDNATAMESWCPVPRPGALSVYVAAEDWQSVLLDAPERRAIFSAALQQDLAEALSGTARVGGFAAENSTMVTVAVEVSIDTAVPYVKATLTARGSTWLRNTHGAYASFGGRGAFAVRVLDATVTAPASPTASGSPAPTSTTARTDDPGPTHPAILNATSRQHIGESAECSPVCIVAIVVGSAIVLLLGGAAAASVALRSTQSRHRTVSDVGNSGEFRASAQSMSPRNSQEASSHHTGSHRSGGATGKPPTSGRPRPPMQSPPGPIGNTSPPQI